MFGFRKLSPIRAKRVLEQSKGSVERFVEFNERFVHSPEDVMEFLALLKPRTRENVVLEFGYFIGKLGRDKVCCLHKGKLRVPSDMQGIVYIPFKSSLREVKNDIIKELQAAGMIRESEKGGRNRAGL